MRSKARSTGRLFVMFWRISVVFLLQHVSLPKIKVTFASAYSIGDVDPRSLQGVWRLTSHDQGGLPFKRHLQEVIKPRIHPMKEFTTFPIKEKKEEHDDSTTRPEDIGEIFITLKDDYTFQQCSSLKFSDGDPDKDDDAKSIERDLASEIFRRRNKSFAWRGTWDLVDGKLILAADRSENVHNMPNDDPGARSGGQADTILVGKVSVHSEESLKENPVLEQREARENVENKGEGASDKSGGTIANDQKARSMPGDRGSVDVHLSVPNGKIKTGKFMYPQNHPSFFEQPIFNPQSAGSFQLQQVLGDLNAKSEDLSKNDLLEKFRKEDLVGKRFYLSSFPLTQRMKKGRKRWSIKQQRYVRDDYRSEKDLEEEANQPGKNMQVMGVELFANNTFSTVCGLGSSTIFRGKWSIIGHARDQLWMQVLRFGFGRSVSGSTFSEGMSLTQDDEKAYWGQINEVGASSKESIDVDSSECEGKKIQVEGAVMVGLGLEPTSVGMFKMIEIEDDTVEDEEDDDDDDDDDESGFDEGDIIDISEHFDLKLDDFGENSDHFNDPGAFE